ncbi:MAG: hypothetical protein K6G22_08075 [Lachnospiraceae bacterium]|nr:hypothetical protein [Lachnospiraceae bacterium]
MVKLGASNEVFYYGGRYNKTFNITYPMRFKEAFDLDLMKESADQAIRCYPEFAIQPVIKDGVFTAEENTDPVAFIPEDGEARTYGCDETNGYMFYFSYKDKDLTLHTFHGLTDVAGSEAFIGTMLYFYMKNKGISMDDGLLPVNVRTSPEDHKKEDFDDIFDPYRKYADPSAQKATVPVGGEVFQIPGEKFSDDINYNHEFLIKLPLSEFLKKTKEYGVSVAPLLMTLFADAMDELYDMKDESFVSMMPVSMRRFFNSNTLVNFSDGVLMVQDAPDRKKSLQERCLLLKQEMDKMLTKESFSRIIADKVAATDKSIEKARAEYESGRTQPETVQAGSGQVKTVQMPKLPFTMGISYAGKVTFGEQIDAMLESIATVAHASVYVILINTFGDVMTISYSQRHDRDDEVRSLQRVLEKHGFDAEIVDLGHLCKDMLDPEMMEQR